MNQICLMKNTIQTYAWGSRTAIADLLDQTVPSHQPQAELWMGAHNKAASKIRFQDRWQALDLLIAQYPSEILGRRVSDTFGKKLPFLLKVLAADQPLSIQAHPDKSQALAGFQRENKAGIAIDAPHRNYKDDQHKPECLYALTPFWGMCGFRSTSEMMTLLGLVWPQEYNSALSMLTKDGIQYFLRYLLTLPYKKRVALVDQVVQKAPKIKYPRNVPHWIHRLAEKYGNDIGVLSPLIRNVVKLMPGQAIYLPAGQLHAYLNGVGIELMANSDNVLRGGLTTKHVDVAELLNILDFMPYRPNIMDGTIHRSADRSFISPSAEFMLTVVQVSDDHAYTLKDRMEVPEILLCTEGKSVVHWQDGEKKLALSKGNSAFVPAGAQDYSIHGKATIFRATVNLSSLELKPPD